ncbi:MAG: hypothetical protein KKB51_00215 [Candidatus Riflebacteria bacterium]|nr:hypothetical protein [Candidatus Riflebacteria bacterium]
MRLVTIWAMLCVFVLLTASEGICAERFLYIVSGKYRFEIHAYDEAGFELYNPKGKLTLSDNKAVIDIKTKGYRPTSLEFPLNENVYCYYAEIVLQNPAITLALVDEQFNPIKECVFNEEPTEQSTLETEFGFTGYFPRDGFKKLTARNFHLHINGKHLYNEPPQVYLCFFKDLCYFEVVVDRTRLDTLNNNHFELIVRKKPKSTKVSAAYLCNLAADYSRNFELATAARSNKSILRLQRRLESNANQLIEFFGSMDAGEQREILGYLSVEGDLARSLKSIMAFAELHR